MMNWRIAVLLVLGMLSSAAVHAQKTTTLRVAATVEEYCHVTPPDLTRINYAAQGGAQVQVKKPLSATCTSDTGYLVVLTKGKWNGTDTITVVRKVPAENHMVDHTLFGGVPATEAVPPSDYADAITARVYY